MSIYLCLKDIVIVHYQNGHHMLALHNVYLVLFIL